MIIYSFIKALHPDEVHEFMLSIDTKTRSRRIMQVLGGSLDISRDELFRRVFKVKRTGENDHLLRNELSILKRKLESFIVENSTNPPRIHALYIREYIMAEWCIKKSLIEFAADYVNAAHIAALSIEAFDDLLKINRLKLYITQFGKSNYQNKLDEMKLLRQDHLQYLKEFAIAEIKYADFINSGAFKLASNLRIDTNPFEPVDVLSIETNGAKNKMAHYYSLKSRAYSTTGLEAIELLNAAITVLYDLPDKNFANVEMLTCYSAMAMEYSLINNFSKSEELYEFIFSLPGSETFASRKALLYNYCTTLLKNGNFKKALRYIEYLEDSNPEPVVEERIYTMKINCYIFLENVKMIRKILPSDLQSYDLTLRTYYRFLYTIYYLIKGEEELAQRELNNIQLMKDFKLTGYMPLVQLFEKYISTLEAVTYKERNSKNKLERIRRQLNDFHNNNPELSGLLPAAWITEKIKRL